MILSISPATRVNAQRGSRAARDVWRRCHTAGVQIPDPALVLLVGASGSGKSAWAAARYRDVEVVSSDALRAVVGSGTADLDASEDAFRLLDQIVEGACPAWPHRRYRHPGPGPGATGSVGGAGSRVRAPAGGRRLRHAGRRMPGAQRLARPARPRRSAVRPAAPPMREVSSELEREGWDVRVLSADEPPPVAAPAATAARRADDGPRVMLQVGRFPWGEDPLGWLRGVALAAAEAGFAGIALMDHLIQIPQVGTAWEPIPEPWVTLGRSRRSAPASSSAPSSPR